MSPFATLTSLPTSVVARLTMLRERIADAALEKSYTSMPSHHLALLLIPSLTALPTTSPLLSEGLPLSLRDSTAQESSGPTLEKLFQTQTLHSRLLSVAP